MSEQKILTVGSNNVVQTGADQAGGGEPTHIMVAKNKTINNFTFDAPITKEIIASIPIDIAKFATHDLVIEWDVEANIGYNESVYFAAIFGDWECNTGVNFKRIHETEGAGATLSMRWRITKGFDVDGVTPWMLFSNINVVGAPTSYSILGATAGDGVPTTPVVDLCVQIPTVGGSRNIYFYGHKIWWEKQL